MNNQKYVKVTEVYPDIYRIALPLPGKKPGTVNAYLFTGNTVVLMDTGTIRTAPQLVQAINKLGLKPSDIDKIVFTHGHIDQGSVCFFIENEKILFSGDTVLPHITPNAFVILDPVNRLPQRLSQQEFFNSIGKIKLLKPLKVFPSHGEAIDDLESIICMYHECYFKRDEIILKHLKNNEYTVYELSKLIFKNELGTGKHFLLQIYLALSEIYTHLQVLKINKKIQLEQKGNKIIINIKPDK